MCNTCVTRSVQVVLLCVILFFANSATAEDLQTVTGSFAIAPKEFLVGEEVTAYIKVPLSMSTRLHEELTQKKKIILQSRDLPPLDLTEPSAELRQINIAEQNNSFVIEYHFIPWTNSSVSFPALSLYGMQLPSFTFQARSVFSQTGIARVIGPFKGQQNPPYFVPILYSFVLAVFVLTMLMVLLTRYSNLFLPPLRRMIRNYQVSLRFTRALKKIEADLNSFKPKEFYRTLGNEIRLYLENFYIPEAQALTATEFKNIEKNSPLPRALHKALGLILFEAEQVRFAGKASSPSERENALQYAHLLLRYKGEPSLHA